MICHADKKWRDFIAAVRKGATLYVHPDTWETLPNYLKVATKTCQWLDKNEIIAVDEKKYSPFTPIWTPPWYGDDKK